MKPFRDILFIILILGGAGLLISSLSSCEGPAGPPGENASETCVLCHNNETLVFEKSLQMAYSEHQTGSSYVQTGPSCAPCHAHKGFMDVLQTGAMTSTAASGSPVPFNCRTCHPVHENYDETDLEVRTGDAAVKLWHTGITVNAGSGNLCINCHQARPVNPMPQVGGANVTISSANWGPHQGPQGNVMWGAGGYEIAGSQSYPAPGTHFHAQAGCNTCHMAESAIIGAGGHSFNMKGMLNGQIAENLNGCTSCHTGISSFDYHGKISEIQTLTSDLKQALMDQNFINEDNSLNASSGTPLVVTSDEAGAILNYLLVVKDRSNGMHNPVYVKALLVNSLEIFQN